VARRKDVYPGFSKPDSPEIKVWATGPQQGIDRPWRLQIRWWPDGPWCALDDGARNFLTRDDAIEYGRRHIKRLIDLKNIIDSTTEVIRYDDL